MHFYRFHPCQTLPLCKKTDVMMRKHSEKGPKTITATSNHLAVAYYLILICLLGYGQRGMTINMTGVYAL